MVVMIAAGRHHSAWAKGWSVEDLARLQRKEDKLRLHDRANEAISQSWRMLLGEDLPQILSIPSEMPHLSDANFERYDFELDCFTSDYMSYQQLYWLVVRGLRICDGRSVQI